MRVLILGGGPVGRACAVAMQQSGHEATILESSGPRIRPTSRDHGAQFLWEALPGFDIAPITVVTEVDGSWGRPDSIRKYKERVGRSVSDEMDRKQWDTQFAWIRPGFRIEGYPNVSTIYNASVKAIYLEERKVATPLALYRYDALVNTLPLPDFLGMCDAPFDELVGLYRSNHAALGIWRTDDARVLDHLREMALRNEPTRKGEDELVYVNYFGASDTCFSRVTYNGVVADFEAVMPMGPPHMCRVTGYCPTVEPTICFRYGKIWSIGEFMHTALVKHLESKKVFLAGRYGAWDQEQLLHDSYHVALQEGERLK